MAGSTRAETAGSARSGCGRWSTIDRRPPARADVLGVVAAGAIACVGSIVVSSHRPPARADVMGVV